MLIVSPSRTRPTLELRPPCFSVLGRALALWRIMVSQTQNAHGKRACLCLSLTRGGDPWWPLPLSTSIESGQPLRRQ
jgi:hypothetical protein